MVTLPSGQRLDVRAPEEECQGEWQRAWDDVSGQELDPKAVRAARMQVESAAFGRQPAFAKA